MDNISGPFSETTTINERQNMGHIQNAHLPFNGVLSFSAPYFVPYYQSLQFPYTNTFQQVNQPLAYPLYSFAMGQSTTVPCGMPNWQSQNEERNIKGALMSKIAREKRLQARRQRNRSSVSGASSILEETRSIASRNMETNAKKNATENRNLDTLCSLDGKRLKKILTKKLKSSDVGYLGRIVLPKKEAEENLPALSNKEGIQVLLKDVYTNQQWIMKYKYWCNNKSRMYVLDNTGDFVQHYELRMGDSLTLYEDEFKNLYVLTKKEQKPKVADQNLPSKEGKQNHNINNYSYIHTLYTHQAKNEEEEASLAILIDELNHKEQEPANNFFTMCSVGTSQSEIKCNKTTEEVSPYGTTIEGPFNQITDQATKEASTSSSQDNITVMDVQQNIDDLSEGLGMSEHGCSYLLLDYLTDDKT